MVWDAAPDAHTTLAILGLQWIQGQGFQAPSTSRLRSTLWSVLLVNMTWAAEAIRILWKNPPVDALAAIKDRDRRQFYACHVRKLEVCYCKGERRMAVYSTLRDMEFPLLKFINIGVLNNETKNDVRLCFEHCIRPSLEEVHFEGFDLDSKMLHLLRRQCPKLKKIAFHVEAFYGSGISVLTELIDSCKSLKSIYLRTDGSEKDFLEEIEFNSEIGFDAGTSRAQHDRLLGSLLRSLAHCNGLEELHLNMIPKYETFSGVLGSLEQPFKDLRLLSMKAVLEARTASLLESKPNPNSLTALDLIIRNTTLTTNPLPQIGLLVNLRNLSIIYLGRRPLSRILPLENLKCLRNLRISGSPLVEELTDKMFIPMVENWPELVFLKLEDQNSKLSTTSLTSLGKHCPRLKNCTIKGEYDLNDWQNIP